MARFDLLIDGWNLKTSLGQIVNQPAAKVRVDVSRLAPMARRLAAETYGLEAADLGGVAWYDGRLPRDLASESAIKAESRFHAALRKNGIAVRTTLLRPQPWGVSGVLRTALDNVENGFEPAIGNPRLRERVRAELDGLQAKQPSFRQKGVDTLLTIDLVELARVHETHTTLLVTGDADFTPAVRSARAAGGRVVLVAVGTSRTPAASLRRAATITAAIADADARKLQYRGPA